MSNFFEIDFLDVASSKSGDAISLRYRFNDTTRIHVVDGGFQDTGDKLVEHIKKYYDSPSFIDFVVVSHPDGDHSGGLRKVLEEFEIGELWMLRPWCYADELIDKFSRFRSIENLSKRLKEIYPNIAVLEDIADEKKILIREPFQGSTIGQFTVMAPTKNRYLDLVVESEKTPESAKQEERVDVNTLVKMVAKAAAMLRAAWGEETFSSQETSAENDMSVIQYANLCDKRILLTADAGRKALSEAADYAPSIGLELPGIDRFQVPHHGSRRNVSTEVLDLWLGQRLPSKPKKGEGKFTAIVSAAEKDKDHPRKSVIRAVIHRGAKAIATEGTNIRTSYNAPDRDGWVAVEPIPYPEEQEE
ncbi:MAG: MBL fold metallo-hydrolase [Symploca sp. SIO1C4]|uniref:MBL fold metallo-hydrolase n=1 Tax=Symploca sp. SIO1C4 TaxID=2607765 RepID=A0A6B3NHB2_9CYAN|nr:MBL fold metallo-hydrolase [Symploca sp. SIO1C4]